MSKLERQRAELVLMCYIAAGGLSFVWAALHGPIIPAQISALLTGSQRWLFWPFGCSTGSLRRIGANYKTAGQNAFSQ